MHQYEWGAVLLFASQASAQSPVVRVLWELGRMEFRPDCVSNSPRPLTRSVRRHLRRLLRSYIQGQIQCIACTWESTQIRSIATLSHNNVRLEGLVQLIKQKWLHIELKG